MAVSKPDNVRDNDNHNNYLLVERLPAMNSGTNTAVNEPFNAALNKQVNELEKKTGPQQRGRKHGSERRP